MKVVVSACLLGENCKYDGGNNYNVEIEKFLKDKEVIAVCPESMSGLGTPRTPVELVNGVAINKNGENVDDYFRSGAQLALKELENQKIDLAILQSRSPSCGSSQIYDGTFSGKLIKGQGMFAKALKEKGIKIVDSSTFVKG